MLGLDVDLIVSVPVTYLLNLYFTVAHYGGKFRLWSYILIIVRGMMIIKWVVKCENVPLNMCALRRFKTACAIAVWSFSSQGAFWIVKDANLLRLSGDFLGHIRLYHVVAKLKKKKKNKKTDQWHIWYVWYHLSYLVLYIIYWLPEI